MRELPAEFLDELEKGPKRRSKTLGRTHRVWFYEVATHLGKCDNEVCTDSRKKPQVMVWTTKDGLNMCRYCFLGDWLKDESR